MNPLELARVELLSPRTSEQALAGLDQLLHDGLEAAGRRYRLFGARHGRFVTMSLGLPFVGGGSPVLRAWLTDATSLGPSRFTVVVGARMELITLTWIWVTLAVLGGGVRLLVQVQDIASGHGTFADLLAVLEGMAIMLGVVGLGVWIFRLRGARDGAALLDAFRRAVGATDAHVVDTAMRPIH